MLDLAGAAKALAIDTENNDLYAHMDTSRNALERLPDNELRDKLESMLNVITPLEGELKSMDVSSDEITAAGKAVAAYRNMIAAPRTVISTRKTNTDNIPGTKRAVRQQLDKMDGLVRRYKRNNPTFTSDFQNARVVVDSGIRHDKPAS